MITLVFFNCDEKNVFEPRDYDITWTKTTCPLDHVDHIFVSPNGSLFAVSEKAMAWDGAAEMYRSADDGETWEKLDWYMGIGDLVFRENGDIFTNTFSQVGNHVLWSTDNGDSWEEMPIASIGYINIGAMTKGPDENIYLGVGNSVYELSDNGSTWTKKGTSPGSVSELAVDIRGNIFLGSTFDIFYSTDGGGGWINTETPEDFELRELCLHPADMIFARTFNKLYFSSTRNFNWKRITEFDTWGLEGLKIDDEGIIYVLIGESHYSPGADFGVFISQDHGISFQKIDPPHEYLRSFELDTGGFMYVGTYNDGLYRSNESF